MIAIGIDIGGMSIKGAAINDKGVILDRFSMPVINGEESGKTINKLIDVIKDFLNSHDYNEAIVGIGLGIPGAINSEKGIVCTSANLKWNNVNVVEILSNALCLPVKITNDANAATLGEARFGASKQYPNSIMLTLGTGIGGGVIINNQLYEGNEGKGSELGHICLVLNGRECGCGRRGCFERYASASGLIMDTKIFMDQYPNSLMNDIAKQYGEVNGRVAFDASKKGDEAAIKCVEQYVMCLSEGLLDLCNIFRPNAIILSGGIANEGDYLISKIVKYLEKFKYGYEGTPKVEIKVASLGYDSGKIGAAALFFNK